MSRTTTAASSARATNLSFGWLLSQLDHDSDTTPKCTGLSPQAWDSDATLPSVNLSSFCRNTFLHLESASPLAKMSQTRMIKSFREFSSKLDTLLGTRPSTCNSQDGSRRRHTLTPVVVDSGNPSLPTRVEPTLGSFRHDLLDENLGESPIARLSNRHSLTFGNCIKDDSFAPNIKQPLTNERTPSPAERDPPFSMVSGSGTLSLLTSSSPATVSCTLPLVTRSIASQSSPLHHIPSPMNHLPVTPTPMATYFDNQGFFLPSELNQGDKDKVFNEEAIDEDCSSPTRSPTRLRPLADLLTEPWGNDDPGLSELSSNKVTSNNTHSPPSTVPSPVVTTTKALSSGSHVPSRNSSAHLTTTEQGPTTTSPHKQSSFTSPCRTECSDISQAPTDFKLSEWAASLPESEVSITDPTNAEPSAIITQWDPHRRNRGSLSDLVHLTDCPGVQNLFASAVAQAMLSGGSEEKKRTSDVARAGAEEASGGHPNSCKPCAFYWSKGCLNGDNCRFCHEWHAPKKKKPMKDQKNLMIIAREDGRIAFLRCAIEDALRHQ